MKPQDYIFVLFVFFTIILHISQPKIEHREETKDIIELNKEIEAPEEYKPDFKHKKYPWDAGLNKPISLEKMLKDKEKIKNK
jgi:hypothetical protein